MGQYASLRVILTDHAYDQYVKRVGFIQKDELLQMVLGFLSRGDYTYMKSPFAQFDRVWWVYEVKDEIFVLVTCYGESDFDVPKAVKWQIQHHDRINLFATAAPLPEVPS